MYIGRWSKGEKHGYGRLTESTRRNNLRQEGYFDRDKFIPKRFQNRNLESYAKEDEIA